MIEYRLIRSKRRSISIEVDVQGAVSVRAPLYAADGEIRRFVTSKTDWIKSRQAAMQESQAQQIGAQLTDGALVPYLGQTLTVRLTNARTAYDEAGVLYLPSGARALEKALQWRMKRAKELLPPRVEQWSDRTGLMPQKLTFGNAAGRWGSMTSQGSLRLNAALVHLKSEMIDYVIVHELVHRVHPNHSPAFHALVRSILPGADAIRKEMKPWGYVAAMWKQSKP